MQVTDPLIRGVGTFKFSRGGYPKEKQTDGASGGVDPESNRAWSGKAAAYPWWTWRRLVKLTPRLEEPEMSDKHDHAHLPDTVLRVKALESLLVEKGLVDPAALDELIETYEHKVGPRNGARVVARAWSDSNYKRRLLQSPSEAMAELGFTGRQGEDMVVLENTGTVHHMVVCTLCSCYPWPVLGLPPVWYKSAPYRARAVIDPRGVLKEFGVELAEETEIRVWDSTAEVRYLVLPMRPEGTEGMDEESLADLVTRDSMIGTGLPLSPNERPEKK